MTMQKKNFFFVNTASLKILQTDNLSVTVLQFNKH